MPITYPDPSGLSDEELRAYLEPGATVPTFGAQGNVPAMSAAASSLAPSGYAKLTAPPEAPAPSVAAPMAPSMGQGQPFGTSLTFPTATAADVPFRSQTHTSTTKMTMTPEEKAAMADIEKIRAGQEASITARGKLLAQGAEVGAGEAAAREEFLQGRVGQVEKEAADDKMAWDTAKARVDEEEAKLRNTPIQSWWETKGVGERVAAALAVGIGALATKPGEQNQVYNILQDAIQNHRIAQLDKINKQKDNVAMARTGLKDAMAAREMQRMGVEAKTAAQYDALASRYATQKAKLGVPAAEIESDQLIQDLRANAAQQRQAVYQGLRTRTTSDTVSMRGAIPGAAGAGKGTEDQRASDFIFQAALPDAKLLLETGGLSAKSRKMMGEISQRREAMPGISKTAEWMGIASTPEEAVQKLGNREAAIKGAEDRSLIYIQRKLSGAGMAEGEAARMAAAFRGGQFDSPSVARAKAENMARFIFATGQQGTDPVRAARMAEAAIQQAAGARAAGAQGTRNIMYNGRPAVQHADGYISYK